ncbi:MAG: membrane lipoprotein lipid attachment site-containing protein [Bacteroidia bacterium]|nr:membrane lipoprotein lipid attachment site-containing protein [Bacteroidia bacterium]
MKKIILLTCISLLLSACSPEASVTSETKPTATTEFSWGKESAKLQMAIRVTDDSLEICLKNNGTDTIKVCSHINAMDLDWITIELKNSKDSIRTLRVGDAVRTGSQMNTKTLKGGESFFYYVDLNYWALQEINSRKALAPGNYNLSVSYKAQDCFYPSKDYWNGEVSAGPLFYEVK